MKKVVLVLGGGGAKSFAHLGIVKVFQRHNIPIDVLVTCSGGSFIGALLASGASISSIKREFYKTIRRIKWFRLSFSRKSILSQSNVDNIIDRLKVSPNIEDLKIPIKIVATNLSLGDLQVFETGSVKDSVKASMAFPGVYRPIKIGDYLYVDGGVLNATPADVARLDSSSSVITVNLDNKISDTDLKRSNAFQIIHRSIYIPLLKQRMKVIKDNSDIILEPFSDYKFNLSSWSDILRFHSIKKMELFYNLGVKEAESKVLAIKEMLN
jgi:NTE family protein